MCRCYSTSSNWKGNSSSSTSSSSPTSSSHYSNEPDQEQDQNQKKEKKEQEKEPLSRDIQNTHVSDSINNNSTYTLIKELPNHILYSYFRQKGLSIYHQNRRRRYSRVILVNRFWRGINNPNSNNYEQLSILLKKEAEKMLYMVHDKLCKFVIEYNRPYKIRNSTQKSSSLYRLYQANEDYLNNYHNPHYHYLPIMKTLVHVLTGYNTNNNIYSKKNDLSSNTNTDIDTNTNATREQHSLLLRELKFSGLLSWISNYNHNQNSTKGDGDDKSNPNTNINDHDYTISQLDHILLCKCFEDFLITQPRQTINDELRFIVRLSELNRILNLYFKGKILGKNMARDFNIHMYDKNDSYTTVSRTHSSRRKISNFLTGLANHLANPNFFVDKEQVEWNSGKTITENNEENTKSSKPSESEATARPMPIPERIRDNIHDSLAPIKNEEIPPKDNQEVEMRIHEERLAQVMALEEQLLQGGIYGTNELVTKQLKRWLMPRCIPPKWLQSLNIKPPKGLLLHGPPGTGKTLLAKELGTRVLNIDSENIHVVHGPEVENPYVGQTARNVRKLFEDAMRDWKELGMHSPLHLIIFDELDSIAKQRGDSQMSKISDRGIQQLLSCLDGIDALHNLLVIGTTNRYQDIDNALLRPGRFDVHIHIGTPDEIQRKQVLNKLFEKVIEDTSFMKTQGINQDLTLITTTSKNSNNNDNNQSNNKTPLMVLSEDVTIDWLVEMTEGLVQADLRALKDTSIMNCLERNLLSQDIAIKDRKDKNENNKDNNNNKDQNIPTASENTAKENLWKQQKMIITAHDIINALDEIRINQVHRSLQNRTQLLY